LGAVFLFCQFSFFLLSSFLFSGSLFLVSSSCVCVFPFSCFLSSLPFLVSLPPSRLLFPLSSSFVPGFDFFPFPGGVSCFFFLLSHFPAAKLENFSYFCLSFLDYQGKDLPGRIFANVFIDNMLRGKSCHFAGQVTLKDEGPARKFKG
jgi:hypothetical protein